METIKNLGFLPSPKIDPVWSKVVKYDYFSFQLFMAIWEKNGSIQFS
jgi:hypothetical protein